MGTQYLILRGRTEYKVELSTSPVGNMVKLENCFNGIHENEEFLLKKIEQYENDLRASKEEYVSIENPGKNPANAKAALGMEKGEPTFIKSANSSKVFTISKAPKSMDRSTTSYR